MEVMVGQEVMVVMVAPLGLQDPLTVGPLPLVWGPGVCHPGEEIRVALALVLFLLLAGGEPGGLREVAAREEEAAAARAEEEEAGGVQGLRPRNPIIWPEFWQRPRHLLHPAR
jgi:hypothetical protein